MALIKEDSVNFGQQSFQNLGPDDILDAVESVGYLCDGRFLALNSYENRVYQVGIEDTAPLVAKFYRPNRWTDECIIEEHQFAYELADAEIPVVEPLRDKNGESLFHHKHFRFALFANKGGHALEIDNLDQLHQIGQFMGRIHAVGRTKAFVHRPELTIASYAEDSRSYLLENNFIPKELITAYTTLTDDLIQQVRWCFERAGQIETLRLHCDCHPSNILIREEQMHIVDLDDSRTGPAVQDLWMFLSGDRADQARALSELLDGYNEFSEFNNRELHLIEALRTLRLIYYHAWLARRWGDPAFPRAFVWFNDQNCWEQHILNLREQAAMMNEPVLELF